MDKILVLGSWMFTDFKPFTDFVYHFQIADLKSTHRQQPLDKNNYALSKAMEWNNPEQNWQAWALLSS